MEKDVSEQVTKAVQRVKAIARSDLLFVKSLYLSASARPPDKDDVKSEGCDINQQQQEQRKKIMIARAVDKKKNAAQYPKRKINC